MQWTMPHRVLQIVAGLIVLSAVAAFAAGVITTPQRGGRLPGEKPAGAGPAAAIDATDATPLSNERIEGPPPPSPEELARAEAEKQAEKERAAAAAAEQAAQPPLVGNAAPPPKLPSLPPEGPPQTLGGPPASDEPPH